jgi:glycosyltransferase involved in cell wall biosynthesis
MKILFFINGLSAGGKERRLTQLMKDLTLNPKIEFELVIMNKDIHYEEVLELNVKIHYLIRKTKKDLSVFPKFYKICVAFEPDIVHCWDSMTAVIAVPCCRLLSILFINGLVVDTPVRQNIFNKDWLRAKLTFPFSHRIIGNSKSGLKAYGAPKNKSSCIYNGIDLKRFENVKDRDIVYDELFGVNTDNLFIIGMVAAFEPRKDYDTFVKSALSMIKANESIRFILVGDGKNFTKIKNKVPLEFSKKIIFLGKRSDVESIVNVFDVGVLLTNTKVHGEGISNSIIEYMASGKPVIATRGGGTNEVVKDNQNGYLINAHDSQQLVQSIQQLIAHKNLLVQFGSKSHEMVHTFFDIKIMTQNYLSMYEQVIKENRY